MKLSSKPIVSSSPSRIEKFPTAAPHLLSRFSRSSGGNRSRGRSRTSPIFFSSFARKKNSNAPSIETPEPSSPKVTCIGQVRVRRSKTPKSTTPPTKNPTRSFCRWLRTALFCGRFIRSKPSQPSAPSHRRFLFISMRKAHRKQAFREGKEEGADRDSKAEQERGDSDLEEDRESKVFVASTTPPKNALLLMRCRSEPHRASALADRFFGSPFSSSAAKENRPPSPEESSDFAAAALTRGKEEQEHEDDEDEEKLAQLGISSRPLILTRCKSEPSARAGKLLPDEASLWKNQKLGFVKRCQSPQSYLH